MKPRPWIVHMTEYERGWGQRPDGHERFETQEAAKIFQDKYNSVNTEACAPDVYSVAHNPMYVPEE